MIYQFQKFVESVDYSYMNHLNSDPEARKDGIDHMPRQVFSGHYVPVAPTPLKNAELVSYSQNFFKELGLSDELVNDPIFQQVFSGDLSGVSSPMKKFGWATGYALSIYGREYQDQCPFGTGNGYGDGRAISVFEGLFQGKRWEMQLKGAGRTPYCRGADGRAVLRSSVREFLAQEHMHALGLASSRSLCLYRSSSETVMRPWYSEGSNSFDPDIMMDHPIAISTRVASSFLRVGQLELFARRARNQSDQGLQELKMIVSHLIEREYREEIDSQLPFETQVLLMAKAFQKRLMRLVANWLRVGYCQGNFNSDNCAMGGFTLDYGPFGFCELFHPAYQPWTGGGRHFSFFNQPKAAEMNFQKFCDAISELLPHEQEQLQEMREKFESAMQAELQKIWCKKLGLVSFDSDLFQELIFLMIETKLDYNIFFRELSHIPKDLSALQKSFYQRPTEDLKKRWSYWLSHWRKIILGLGDPFEISQQMKKMNPKYTWREWLIVPAYQKAAEGDYSLIRELQEVLGQPYDEQSAAVEQKYYQLTPKEYLQAGGISHYSCSS